MGTSTSSSGPRSRVSFDPPWINSVVSEISFPTKQITGEDAEPDTDTQETLSGVQNIQQAPSRRFGNARRYMGKYLKNGERIWLQKALGSYSQKGMGGASNVARRMKVSTTVGAELFRFLQEIRDSTNTNIRDWVNQLTSLPTHEIADKIINQVITVGGSLEEESCRDSMAKALSDLLIINPETNLLNMDNSSIWIVIESFIAHEAFNRLILDIGQLFESSKHSLSVLVNLMNEMRDFLKSEISAQIQKRRNGTSKLNRDKIYNLLQSAIEKTFKIFEDAI